MHDVAGIIRIAMLSKLTLIVLRDDLDGLHDVIGRQRVIEFGSFRQTLCWPSPTSFLCNM